MSTYELGAALPNAETYEHPLYAVLGDEAISLEGHLKLGVIKVLNEVAARHGYDPTPGQPTRLIHDPAELTETLH